MRWFSISIQSYSIYLPPNFESSFCLFKRIQESRKWVLFDTNYTRKNSNVINVWFYLLTRIISFSEGGNVASETSSGNHHHSQQQHHGPPGTKYLYVLELNHRRPVFGSGGRFRLLANGSLVIRNVGETDEGNYLCEADNGVNEPLGKVAMLKVNGTFYVYTYLIHWYRNGNL